MTIACPCCDGAVAVPPLDALLEERGLTDMEAAILGAVWRGRGMPVMCERIFDAMYADDPDGGPTPSRMYMQFKAGRRALLAKLAGSGVGIVSGGWKKGWRLVIADDGRFSKQRDRDHCNADQSMS